MIGIDMFYTKTSVLSNLEMDEQESGRPVCDPLPERWYKVPTCARPGDQILILLPLSSFFEHRQD